MAPPHHADYVLGVTREEYSRLGIQHDLWASRMVRLLKRAGLPQHSKKSLNVLDCGCGPGFTTFEIARYLGPNSKVTGIDLSDKYLRLLESQASTRTAKEKSAQAEIFTKNAPLDSFSLEKGSFDAAFARWIFIFLKDPEAAIVNIAKHLKPGGVFMLQEYVNYGTLTVHPSGPIFNHFIKAVMESWADNGGDANVGQKLPALLKKHGFEVTSLRPQARIGRPHQKIWQWPDTFFKNYIPVLEREEYLSSAEAAEIEEIWEDACTNPDAFFVGPLVVDIIARKL